MVRLIPVQFSPVDCGEDTQIKQRNVRTDLNGPDKDEIVEDGRKMTRRG
jgi:hypothetical protein